MATQLRILPTMLPCPRLSLQRRCCLPEFSTSLTPHSLGSGYHFFVAPFHRDSRPSASWESRALPAAAPRGHLLGELLGEPLRYLPLYQAPPPLAYSFAPPRRDELITSLPPGLVKLLRSSSHLVFTLGLLLARWLFSNFFQFVLDMVSMSRAL